MRVDSANRDGRGFALAMLLTCALVAILLPVCAMPVSCDAGSMSHGGFASLADCQFMWYPSDAPGAVLVEVLVLFVVAALFIAALTGQTPRAMTARAGVSRVAEDPPDPPDDPLFGRLLI